MALIQNPNIADRVYIPVIVQLYVLLAGSWIHLLYVLISKPFEDPNLNYLEIFNSAMVYTFNIFFFILTKTSE